MKHAGDLYAALEAAGVPVADVSIGKRDDKSTWRIIYRVNVTKAQQTAVQAIVDAFDMNAPDTPAPLDELAAKIAALKPDELAELSRRLATTPQN